MITDEMLREAAAKTSAAYLRYVEQGYDPENQHVFSPEFEKKMEKLIRKAKHIFLYHTLRRVVSVVLAVLIGASAWLAVDVNARAVFFGWVKETYEMLFVYRHSGESSLPVENPNFKPTWLPDGYTEFMVVDENGGVTVLYKNEENRRLRFCYIYDPSATEWYIDTSHMKQAAVQVNGSQADLFLATDEETANMLMWTDPVSNMAFYVSAFLDEVDLFRIAESIKPN